MFQQFPFRFGLDIFPDMNRGFQRTFSCFSVSLLPGNEREDVERGGKIIMPPSALDTLTRNNVNYPMLFKLTNYKTNRVTHCGVLEFVADEDKVYIPYWMMHNLLLDEGDPLLVESAALPVGTYSKFQPLSSEFLDITNQKAVLENSLRNFACLSKGDVIAIKYNNKVYELSVLETKPGEAISIIECDMNVEFAAPVDYKDKETKMEEEVEDLTKLMPPPKGFIAFSGEASRLDGKKRKDTDEKIDQSPNFQYKRGIPDYNYKIGTLKFFRNSKPIVVTEEEVKEEFLPFSGTGTSLRDSRKD